jgi:prepilin-type processing-associated H-X9-DG protein
MWLTVNVPEAAHVPLFSDSARDHDTPCPEDTPPQYDGQIYYSNPGDINEIRSRCINRHRERINCLFLDSSVRYVGLKELWLLWWARDWPVPLAMARPIEWNDPTHWMYGMKDY